MLFVRRCLGRVRSRLRLCRWKSRSSTKTSDSSFVRAVDMKSMLKPRVLQQNAGELASFACADRLASLSDVEEFCRKRSSATESPATIFVLDAGDDDFGSRANFGRGHNFAALDAGCPTSFDSFLARLGNVALNSLNRQFIEVRSCPLMIILVLRCVGSNVCFWGTPAGVCCG